MTFDFEIDSQLWLRTSDIVESIWRRWEMGSIGLRAQHFYTFMLLVACGLLSLCLSALLYMFLPFICFPFYPFIYFLHLPSFSCSLPFFSLFSVIFCFLLFYLFPSSFYLSLSFVYLFSSFFFFLVQSSFLLSFLLLSFIFSFSLFFPSLFFISLFVYLFFYLLTAFPNGNLWLIEATPFDREVKGEM